MLKHLDHTEDVKSRSIENDPAIAADPRVKKAQAKLDRLTAAGAASAVLDRAHRALKDARLDFLERIAEKNAKRRADVIAEQKMRATEATGREIAYRLADEAPSVIFQFYGIIVRIRPERPADGTQRVAVYNEIAEVLRVVRGMSERAVGGVRRNLEPQIDREFVIRDLQDRLRRGIAAGAVTITEA